MLPLVYLVRHGETEWSLSGRHTGKTEVQLTPRGEIQARAVGAQLRGLSIPHVLVSPRLRALRTYELAGLAVAAHTDQDLPEWDYGDYEGLRSTEILEKNPPWNLFRDGCPGGESPAQVGARADAVVARLRKAEGNVAIFSHGHFLRVLGARWSKLPVEAAERFGLSTAALCILSYEHDDPERPIIMLWNQPPNENARPS